MKPSEHYIGERLSYKHQLCTVRCVGPVKDKPGVWLGVEWDDPSRGKHNGTHEGVTYFECTNRSYHDRYIPSTSLTSISGRSTSPTVGSFLRPTQTWDPPRTFFQALQEKYMPEFHESEAEIVYISGKQAEEVGFEKFHQRQAKLQGIHVLVLDHMRIKHQSPSREDEDSIEELCADITELDLSGNLFETFDEVVKLCGLLPKLKVLTLDGNRFTVDKKQHPALRKVRTLSLSQTLLNQTEIKKLVSDSDAPVFPSLSTLNLANNEFCCSLNLLLPPTLSTLDLSDNGFCALSDLKDLSRNGSLHTLILKRNRISAVCADTVALARVCLRVAELDLSYNAIDTFSFFTSINPPTFPQLKHLRVAGNPLYKSLVSAEGKPLTAEDGYMLTIARLPQLEYLNYSKITEKERLNAESYYLGQIAIEVSSAGEGHEADVISRHPRYRELCDEYGEPNIQWKVKKNEVDPNSLAARLVSVTFNLALHAFPDIKQRSWSDEIPKSFSIYAVLGMVGKRLGQIPLHLRLVLETNERDPVGMSNGYEGPEWWDSSDDEDEAGEVGWVRRDVEMVAGTRALGTFVDGLVAMVRVERRDGYA